RPLSPLSTPPLPSLPLFPYTTLFRSAPARSAALARRCRALGGRRRFRHLLRRCRTVGDRALSGLARRGRCGGRGDADARSLEGADRKSTRLNSSHVSISYAVCCLKKK